MKLQLGIPFGHAFVNFLTPTIARHFAQHFEGLTFRGRHLSTGVQRLQGKEVLIARYRNSPVMHSSVPPAHRPTLFHFGQPVAFPAPTRHIEAPRCRACRNRLPAPARRP